MTRHPSAQWVGLVLAAVAAVISAYCVVYGQTGHDPFIGEFDPYPPYRIDLDVYRLGAQVFLDGGNLYGPLPDTEIGANLPFTYPPLAAMLFVPLTFFPMYAANLLFSAVTVGLVGLVAFVVVRELTALRGVALAVATLAALAGSLWLGPVRETIEFGQVNVVLMALVVVDVVLGRGRRWQGVLVGLAIAIKLTPVVFLGYFLIRRDWRALATAVGSAVGLTLLGFLLRWEDSVTYWTDALRDPTRIGRLAYVGNQSLNGLLHRLGLDEHVTVVWFLLCAALGLSLLWVMWRQFAGGHDVAAMLTMAFFALLASPVSWSHHWVWASPALILLAVRAGRTPSPGAIALVAAGVWVFVGQVIWGLPNDAQPGLEMTAWQQVVGNAQVLWGLAFVAYLAWWVRRERTSTPGIRRREVAR